MQIVVLDGFTLNPGDLSWDLFKKLGEVTIYDRTPVELIQERSLGATAILTNKTPLNAEFFAQILGLKYIGILATGYNVVDIDAAKRHNVIVTNIPTYGTRSVAQLTFALLLELCHHLQGHSAAVRSGAWTAAADFSLWNGNLVELADKTMGIIGFGRIGRQVAEIAAAFGMNVIGCDSSKSNPEGMKNFPRVELRELLTESDVVSLHCPLLPETREIINKQTLGWMKPTAFLINTSRGQLVAEPDLAEALNNKTIAGAGLDVLATEPPLPDNPLLTAKNCVLTPHIAWATKEARTRLMAIAVNNLEAFLSGKPVNVVA